MVRKGLAPSVKMAYLQMDDAGLTVEYIAQVFVDALNKPCPGMCVLDDGRSPHIITDPDDLHGDWRDPRYCLTPENFGALCSSCNRQKRSQPWPDFAAQQRAVRTNLDRWLRQELAPFPTQGSLAQEWGWGT
jgi:hypothetical protein